MMEITEEFRSVLLTGPVLNSKVHITEVCCLRSLDFNVTAPLLLQTLEPNALYKEAGISWSAY